MPRFDQLVQKILDFFSADPLEDPLAVAIELSLKRECVGLLRAAATALLAKDAYFTSKILEDATVIALSNGWDEGAALLLNLLRKAC